MKILSYFTLLLVLSFCSEIAPPEDAMVFFPEGLSELETKIISSIKEKEKKSPSDFIQLAVIYADYDVNPKTIRFIINESMELDAAKTCELLNGILTMRSYCSLAKNYSLEVTSILSKRGCNETNRSIP